MPKGFFLHEGKLVKHDLHKNSFPDHKGRPGKVGGSSPLGGGSSDKKPLEKRTKEALMKMDENILRKHMRQAGVGLGKYSRADLKEEMDRRRHLRKKKSFGIPGLYKEITK